MILGDRHVYRPARGIFLVGSEYARLRGSIDRSLDHNLARARWGLRCILDILYGAIEGLGVVGISALYESDPADGKGSAPRDIRLVGIEDELLVLRIGEFYSALHQLLSDLELGLSAPKLHKGDAVSAGGIFPDRLLQSLQVLDRGTGEIDRTLPEFAGGPRECRVEIP